MHQCLLCEFNVEDIDDLRNHVLQQHPTAMFSRAMKKRFVTDAVTKIIDEQCAQPIEWMQGEHLKCQTLVRAFGNDDPVNLVDVFNLYVFDSDDHSDDCTCEDCSMITEDAAQRTYAEVLCNVAGDRHSPYCKCAFCKPTAVVETPNKAQFN